MAFDTPSARARRGLPLITALLVAGAHAQVTKDPLATLLVCQPSDSLTANVSHDPAGTPLGAGVFATSGTHECGVQTQGPGTAQPDGAWRFEWTHKIVGQTRYRATVKRVGADGYTLALEPAACGTQALPASIALSAKGKGCQSRVDRDHAFVLFWRQLRDAVAQRDGAMLQRLSLPQLEFAEGPDYMKAPATIMRTAAACMPDVPTNDGRTDLGKLLKATDSPRLDMPPMSWSGDASVSAGNAFTARWTPQGWRLESFNASRSVFATCKAR